MEPLEFCFRALIAFLAKQGNAADTGRNRYALGL